MTCEMPDVNNTWLEESEQESVPVRSVEDRNSLGMRVSVYISLVRVLESVSGGVRHDCT